MTTQDLTQKELEEKLEAIITQLEKKGLIPKLSPTEKNDITKKVSEKLINDPTVTLSKADLRNEDTLKALGLACMAQLSMEKIPDFKFNYSILFKKQMEIEPKELQNELKLLFTNVLKLNPSYQKKTQMEKLEMEADVNKLAEQMATKIQDGQEPLYTNDKVMGFMMAGLDLLSEQRRTLYGVDTHEPGSVAKTVTEVPFGEQMGLLDLATTGDSFMAKKGDPTPGEFADPLALHIAAAFNFLADGNVTSYEQHLMNNDIIPGAKPEERTLPTPLPTKPTPFNEK